MSRLTRGGTAQPVSRDQTLKHARRQGNIHFPSSTDHEQDWQPYPIDPYSAIYDDHTYIQYNGGFLPDIMIQPEYGDEQADAGRDCRTRLARPNSQVRTGTGRYSFSLFN